jgi:serine/threonine protein kinase
MNVILRHDCPLHLSFPTTYIFCLNYFYFFSEYFFLSPYLENGSLRSCIDYDKEEKDRAKIKLKHMRRIEILFQVASAIHYLHTPVKAYR